MEHHQQHFHLSQLGGGGGKRPLEQEEETREGKEANLPEQVEDIPPADKVVYVEREQSGCLLLSQNKIPESRSESLF